MLPFDEEVLGKVKACLLRQGIAYLKQFNAFIKRFEELQGENIRLKEEIEKLKAEIEKLKRREEKEKTDAKAMRKMFAWYLNLWNGEPPEKFKYERWNTVLGKKFKKLLKLFQDEKKVMKEYEKFLTLYKDFMANKRFSPEELRMLYKLFTDGSITNFESKLPLWVQYRQRFTKSYNEEEKEILSELERLLKG